MSVKARKLCGQSEKIDTKSRGTWGQVQFLLIMFD